MAYTTIDKPSDYFNTVLYTGTGSSNSISGVNFQPDWVWIKKRNAAVGHRIYDSVRGVQNTLFSDDSAAEGTGQSTTLTAFNSDGFTVISESGVNASGDTYASWNWLAGTAVSGTTNNSKSYSGSVNTTSGISIINFVGDGTAGHEIPHHLGVAPKMVIVKNRTSGTTNWQTYHYNLDDGAGTHEIFLDLTSAKNASSGAWNNTAPSSTVVTKGTGSYGNENNSNHIMYSFAEKKGFSKFGSYTGNGNADGTFIYTGFKPAWVMIKSSTTVEGWIIFDNKRNGFNVQNRRLMANTSGTEGTTDDMDILSNGFKIRDTGGVYNTSGAT